MEIVDVNDRNAHGLPWRIIPPESPAVSGPESIARADADARKIPPRSA